MSVEQLADAERGVSVVLDDHVARALAELRSTRWQVVHVAGPSGDRPLDRVGEAVARRLVELAHRDLDWRVARTAERVAALRPGANLAVVTGAGLGPSTAAALGAGVPVVAFDVAPDAEIHLDGLDVVLTVVRGAPGTTGAPHTHRTHPGLLSLAGRVSDPLRCAAGNPSAPCIVIVPPEAGEVAAALVEHLPQAFAHLASTPRVRVLATTPHDRAFAASAIAAGVALELVAWSDVPPALTVDLFAQADAVVAGRADAALLAWGVGTPAVAVGEPGDVASALDALGVPVEVDGRRAAGLVRRLLDLPATRGHDPVSAQAVAALVEDVADALDGLGAGWSRG